MPPPTIAHLFDVSERTPGPTCRAPAAGPCSARGQTRRRRRPPAGADRGLRRARRRADRRARLAAAARSTGCACPTFDSAACFARAARHPGQRPLAADRAGRDHGDPALPRTTRSSWRRRTRPPHGTAVAQRDDAAQRRPRRPRAAARLHPRQRRGRARVDRPVRVRRRRAVGAPRRPTTTATTPSARSPARTRCCCAATGCPRPTTTGTRTGSRCSEGESVELRADLDPVVGPGAAAADHRGPDRQHPDRLGPLGAQLRVRRAPTARPSSGRCWCCACSPTPRPAASSPRARRRCPRTSAASATGTTASAGCATPR